MLKLLIVDDEAKICKVIRHLIVWEEMGVEVTGECRNVPEAIARIREEQPDIVITDIRMPGYNGIELIRQMKEAYPKIHFIIISGYSQFEYAHNAIKYGVDDYLLKPIKKKELVQTIQKIQAEMKKEQQREAEKQSLKEKVQENTEIIKKGFLRNLLHDTKLKEFPMDIRQINDEYHTNFQNGYYQILIAKPFLDYDQGNQRIMKVLMEKTERLMHEYLFYSMKECVHVIFEDQIYFVLNGEEEQLHLLDKLLRKIYVDVLGWKDIFGNIRLYFSLSHLVTDVKLLGQEITLAEATMLNRFWHTAPYLLKAQEQKTEEKRTGVFSKKENLKSALEALDDKEVEKCLVSLHREFLTAPGVQGELIQAVYKEIVDIFWETSERLKVSKDSIEDHFRKIFIYSNDISQLIDNLKKEMISDIQQWRQVKDAEQTRPIRVARQYIRTNYNQSITLERVSKYVGLNPTYFSNLFKGETGQNFSEYLIEVRIEHAKDMLANTNKSITEITELTGYGDVKYFSKLFKKTTGLTPREYRKLYQ